MARNKVLHSKLLSSLLITWQLIVRENIYISKQDSIRKLQNNVLGTVIGYDPEVASSSNITSTALTLDETNGVSDVVYYDEDRKILVRYNTLSGDSNIIAGIPNQAGSSNQDNVIANQTKLIGNSKTKIEIAANRDVFFIDGGVIKRINNQGILNVISTGEDVSTFVLSPIDQSILYYVPYADTNVIKGYNLTDGSIGLYAGVLNVARYEGDGVSIQVARFSSIQSLAMNQKGEMVIADFILDGSARFRMVSSGIIRTILGNGKCEYHVTPSNSSMTDYPLCESNALTFDKAGNLYYVENYLVLRRIDFTSNTVTSLAGGNGDNYSAKSSLLASAGTNHLFDFYGNEMIYFGAEYLTKFADIRKVDKNGIILNVNLQTEVYAGSVSVGFLSNHNFAVSSKDGNYYYIDSLNQQVRKFSPSNKNIEIISGSSTGYLDGNLTSSKFSQPNSIQISSNGVMFISESNTGNNRIRMIHPFTQKVYTIAGTGVQGAGSDNSEALNVALNNPMEVKLANNGTLYFIDNQNNRLLKLSPYCPVTGYVLDEETKTSCIPVCFGQLYNSTNACSKRGQCMAPNNCSCQEGYYGSNCELFYCSGKLFNSSSVCSNSNGTCSAPNTCKCSTGFYGNECEIFDCFGTKKSETSVCSSKGVCILPNKCKCSSGRYGDYCQLIEGVLSGVESTSNMKNLWILVVILIIGLF